MSDHLPSSSSSSVTRTRFLHPLAGIDFIHGSLDPRVGLEVRDEGVLDEGREGGKEGESWWTMQMAPGQWQVG